MVFVLLLGAPLEAPICRIAKTLPKTTAFTQRNINQSYQHKL